MEQKVKEIVVKYIELTRLIREKTTNKTTIEIYEISAKIYNDIKLKYPSIKIIDKIEEAKLSFIENPYKYLDNTKFEIEI
jgi:hypothetical protein